MYFNLACLCSMQEDIEPCVANLEQALDLDESNMELGRTAEDLEWARRYERVRRLLGLP